MSLMAMPTVLCVRSCYVVGSLETAVHEEIFAAAAAEGADVGEPPAVKLKAFCHCHQQKGQTSRSVASLANLLYYLRVRPDLRRIRAV